MSETTQKTFQNIRGTFDVLPAGSDAGETRIPGSPAWRFVEDLVQEVLERYHFEEIRTPILEPTELIARGVGELTDIVTKEMFAFERGDTHYVLRPEITAPVMRASDSLMIVRASSCSARACSRSAVARSRTSPTSSVSGGPGPPRHASA